MAYALETPAAEGRNLASSPASDMTFTYDTTIPFIFRSWAIKKRFFWVTILSRHWRGISNLHRKVAVSGSGPTALSWLRHEI